MTQQQGYSSKDASTTKVEDGWDEVCNYKANVEVNEDIRAMAKTKVCGDMGHDPQA